MRKETRLLRSAGALLVLVAAVYLAYPACGCVTDRCHPRAKRYFQLGIKSLPQPEIPTGFINMAGPCSRIFVPRKISSSDESRIRSVIDSIASKIEGNDFWIAGQPFFVDFGEPEEDERNLVLDGWRPEGVISYCAMCNDQCDHVLLAMLCYRTAELLGGLIALDDISMITQDPSVLTFDGRRPIEGYGYIVHPRFLGYWMSHPDFRLVK